MIYILLTLTSFVAGMLVGSNNYHRIKTASKRVEDALVRAEDEIKALKEKLSKK